MANKLFNTYIPATSITAGGQITSTSVNNRVIPVDTYLDGYDGEAATIRTTNGSLGALDVVTLVNASGGSLTYALPATSTASNTYFILKKIDSSLNTATFNRAGSDVIENYESPLTTPTATSIVLRWPDEQVTLFCPTGSTQWRIVNRYNPFIGKLVVRAHPTVNQTGYTTPFSSVVALQNDSSTPSKDAFGWFDTATSRFMPTIPGSYRFDGLVTFEAGAAANMVAQIRVNGVAYSGYESGSATGNLQRNTVNYQFDMNGTTDFAELGAYASVSRTSRANINETFIAITYMGNR